jgi:hypothetical protein
MFIYLLEKKPFLSSWPRGITTLYILVLRQSFIVYTSQINVTPGPEQLSKGTAQEYHRVNKETCQRNQWHSSFCSRAPNVISLQHFTPKIVGV